MSNNIVTVHIFCLYFWNFEKLNKKTFP